VNQIAQKRRVLIPLPLLPRKVLARGRGKGGNPIQRHEKSLTGKKKSPNLHIGKDYLAQ